MSYVHCAKCQRAYSAIRSVACPTCGQGLGPTTHTPTEAILAAADALARTLERATEDERQAAAAVFAERSGRRRIASGTMPFLPTTTHADTAITAAISPASLPAPQRLALLAGLQHIARRSTIAQRLRRVRDRLLGGAVPLVD